MTLLPMDTDLIEEVAARLQLRATNKAALEAVARRLDEADEPLDGVCDLATGVGKTYIAAALVDYLYESGVRNIMIVTPGSTVFGKTVNNFTPGHAKYVNGLESNPLVITSEDFDRGAVAHALADDTRLKVFVFNVQQLIKPTQNTSRKVREHDENLGGSLYEHLQQVSDLVVIADEHHVYFGKNAKAFTAAVKDLKPLALIGLTATPSENTTDDQIIYNYPLAAAIADGFVKIPVLVARKDGQVTLRRQLADGLLLLDRKREALVAYCAKQDCDPVNPVMFVVCESIDDANEVASELRGPDMLNSDEAVLVVTSESPDESLAALDKVEDPASPVRAIVSVQMLKEGWDVKNIYVICALRALESQALSEQILGRGLRLPFGTRTGVPMLDTVEVLSHRRFHDLLANARALLEATFKERAEKVVAETATGQVSGTATATGGEDLVLPSDGEAADQVTRVDGIVGTGQLTIEGVGTAGASAADSEGSVGLVFQEFEDRAQDAEAAILLLQQDMSPRSDAPRILFPRLDKQIQPQPFTLSDVADDDARLRGLNYRSEIASPLDRVGLVAERRGEVIDVTPRKQAEDIAASQEMLPVIDLITEMTGRVLGSGLVIPETKEKNAVRRLIRAFLAGAGVDDPETAEWSQRRVQAATDAFLHLVREKHKNRPSGIVEKIEPIGYPPSTLPSVTETLDRYTVQNAATFVPGKPYTGWTKSILPAAAFDAYSTEYRLADLLDSAPEITWWVRVLPNYGAYLNYGANQRYIPDLIAIDTSGVHWLIEGKADVRANDKDVLAKKEAAERWVRHVNDSGEVEAEWRYLFATETNVKHAAGSWVGLKQVTGS